MRTLRCEFSPCEWRDACDWLCQQGLSNQEGRAALLMAYRRTNKEVALAMGKSVRTAEHHVAGALTKLMVRRQQVWGTLAAAAAHPPQTAPRCMAPDAFHSRNWYPPLGHANALLNESPPGWG